MAEICLIKQKEQIKLSYKSQIYTTETAKEIKLFIKITLLCHVSVK